MVDAEIARRNVTADGDPRQSIREMSRWDFEQAQTDPGTQLRLVVAALGSNHPGAVNAVRATYNDITTSSADALIGEFARWGANLRQPFTFQKLGVLVTALAEGLQLRAKLDPDAVSAELFGDAVVALIGAVADVEQTHSHIDDVIGPLVDKAIGSYRFAQADDLPDDPAQAIIDAAAGEFSKRGYFNTTRTQIAIASGVPPSILDKLFPTSVDIVAAALRPPFERLKQRTSTDSILRTPDEALRRYLEQLAILLCDNRSMAVAMTMILSMERFQTPVSATELLKDLHFPSLIIDPVEAGQRDGIIVNDIPATTIAATLVNNVLFLSLRDPTALPGSIAATVERLCLRGLICAPGAGNQDTGPTASK
ncbi:TetR/AcrR family transcriptional regulator [Antrihabitans stalactiti]|uniref:TetR/AcrR family transcriptional regulator n=1 Tax=Antrihabitans stalactiti TaxID=2584121 RepID=A0A848K9K0_9NOCA|nr:TetR/AcrR family transcriptional regulator [Antrihabitans stalactiti]NMN95091.1 TetR/AcrR family transcriptional regulator [Antrihabitans stalactiti]